MTLTEAQKRALDQLPITFDAEDPVTTDGVQWRTIEALDEEGLVRLSHVHYHHRDDPDKPQQWLIEVQGRGEGRDS